jgi:hypothetical protein
MDNDFGAAVRNALLDFVEHGECSRIHVPPSSTPIIIRNEQIDISLTKAKYQPVVDWLLSLRPGVRNAAVKVVLRSAIANPVMCAFGTDNFIVEEPPAEAKKPSVVHAPTAANTTESNHNIPARETSYAVPASRINEPQVCIGTDATDDDDFDLIGFDAFDNI